MIKRFLQQRLVWFFLGVAFLPTVLFVVGRFGGPNPKTVMPFTSVLEESRTEFFLPADYSYSLRSKGSVEEFHEFVRTMKLEAYRLSETRFEKKEGDRIIVVEYNDGWVTYRESQD